MASGGFTDTPEKNGPTRLADLLSGKNIVGADMKRIRRLEEQNRELQDLVAGLRQELAELQGRRPDASAEIGDFFAGGLEALKNGELVRALELFAAVVVLDGEHVKGRINLAVVLAELGLTAQALELLERVLRMEPDPSSPNHVIARQNIESIRQNA